MSELSMAVARKVVHCLAGMPLHLGLSELCHELSWSSRLMVSASAISLGGILDLYVHRKNMQNQPNESPATTTSTAELGCDIGKHAN
jgi:hypothetical protein